jgi:hypothetical protein
MLEKEAFLFPFFLFYERDNVTGILVRRDTWLPAPCPIQMQMQMQMLNTKGTL